MRCASATASSSGLWEIQERRRQALLQRFFDGVEKYTPQLVSWNGGGFDLPVLHYRALVHGVQAHRYWDLGEDDRDFKWNNYISRYHMRHLDLMDLLSLYQPRAAAPLDEIARLLGFPGKLGMDGSKVWDAFQRGELAAIRNYCETDAANTYLVFLRFQLLRGLLTAEQYEHEIDLCMTPSRAPPPPHWQEFIGAWQRDPSALRTLAPPRADPPTARGRWRSIRKGAVSRASTAKWCSSTALFPARLVEYQRWRRKPNFDLANLTRVLRESSVRVVPLCPHYERCGGCSLQHLDPRAQVAIKQRVLEDNLARIGKVEPRHAARADPRPVLGLSASRALVRQACGQQGRSTGGFPRASHAAGRGHGFLRGAAATDFRADSAAARTDLGLDCRQPHPADRSSDRRGGARY